MDEPTKIYEREKLYEEVWKEPVLVVANRYGVQFVVSLYPTHKVFFFKFKEFLL